MNRAYFRLLDDLGAVPALDGLRGVAIVMVVLYHVVDSFAPAGTTLLGVGGWDLARPLLSGWMGVNLFFVLSGFLITWHLLRRWPRGEVHSVRIYLARRFIRIAPTYYVVLAITAAGLIPHYVVDGNLLGLQVAWHVAFLQDYLPSSILGPFWSLAVEEKFYLVMPVVFLTACRLPRLSHRITLLAGIALVPLLLRIANYAVTPEIAEASFLRDWRNPFHLNLDGLFAGVIIAWLFTERTRVPLLDRRDIGPWSIRAGVLLIAALMIAPGVLDDTLFFYFVAVFPLTALGMGLIVFGAVLRPPGSNGLLESPWLARAGRIAYPWYLTHVLVLHWAWGELMLRAPAIESLSRAAQLAVFLPIYLAGSILAALVLHFLIEKPCLLLKDSIGRPRRAQKPAFTTQAA